MKKAGLRMRSGDLSTVQFLRILGSPFVDRSYEMETENLIHFYKFACKNKASLLYLETLRRLGRVDPLQKQYDRLVHKYTQIENAILSLSKTLCKLNIDYAFFKSIKPYPEVTVDIDVLIFGERYEEVVRAMSSTGYVILGKGPLSTTFRDHGAGVDFDVYNEVGVSKIIYLDKYLLSKSSIDRYLGGHVIRVLSPAADLLAVIAHSVIKEQMYVLSEFYITLSYLAMMKIEDFATLLSLGKNCRLGTAIRTHVGITALLHQTTYGCVPRRLRDLLKVFGANLLEQSRVQNAHLSMPHKYHPITILRTFVEKSKEEKARRSIAMQMANMCSIDFTSGVLSNVIHHVLRETY